MVDHVDYGWHCSLGLIMFDHVCLWFPMLDHGWPWLTMFVYSWFLLTMVDKMIMSKFNSPRGWYKVYVALWHSPWLLMSNCYVP